MLYFLVPAAGRGERLAERGHKPFFDMVDGLTMLDHVLQQAPKNADIHIGVQRGAHNFGSFIHECTVHVLKGSPGQANTIYQMLRRIETKAGFQTDDWLLISNCDNIIGAFDIDRLMRWTKVDGVSGVVAVHTTHIGEENKWSFCHTTKDGRVMKITEKKDYTRHAVCGVYLVRARALSRVIMEDDIHLSASLSRLFNLTVEPVRTYHPWNDMEQLLAWEKQVTGSCASPFSYKETVRD